MFTNLQLHSNINPEFLKYMLVNTDFGVIILVLNPVPLKLRVSQPFSFAYCGRLAIKGKL